MATIELKANPQPTLQIPAFNCDGILCPNMENYEMLQHLNGFRFTTITGLPGSGKTSLLISWLTGKGKNQIFRKTFHNVLLVMPQTSRNSLVKNPFAKHDEEKMFEELDYDTTETIYSMLKSSSEEKETTLLILDDVTANLKHKDIQKLLRKIIFNRRHLKTHVVMMVQSYIAIPKEIRKLNDNVIMFRPAKPEFENLFNELFQTKKDLAVDIMNFVFTDKHDYLFMNVPTQKMYKKYDEVIIHTPDDNENKIL